MKNKEKKEFWVIHKNKKYKVIGEVDEYYVVQYPNEAELYVKKDECKLVSANEVK